MDGFETCIVSLLVFFKQFFLQRRNINKKKIDLYVPVIHPCPMRESRDADHVNRFLTSIKVELCVLFGALAMYRGYTVG